MILALLKRYSSSDGSSCDVLLIMNEAYVEPFVARNGLLIRSALENLTRWESFSQKGGRLTIFIGFVGKCMLSVGYYHCLIGM